MHTFKSKIKKRSYLVNSVVTPKEKFYNEVYKNYFFIQQIFYTL